uniref:Uncharacterized protein n=1 Tax=Elaeophora elaphi TaxID=1147741 RepID=A0A0R3RJJ3_9BILA
MTDHHSAIIFNCKQFPSTSKFHDCIGISQSMQEKNGKNFDNEYAVMKSTQFENSIINRRKSCYTSSRNKQLLAEIPFLNITEISTIELSKVAENEEESISKIENMQIWRFEKRSDVRNWKERVGRNESKKAKLNRKWCKLRSIPLLLLPLLLVIIYPPIQLVTAKLKIGSGYCESNSVPLLATSYVVTPALAALFGRTCRCAFDWRAHFCKQIERYKSLLAVPEMHRHENDQLPIVCICRQLISENHCQQFMTQCYFTPGNQHEECTCCFNQPTAFCNQLQCRNGEPIFDVHANTTCICYAPAFYPYNICTYQSSLFYDQGEVVVSANHDDSDYTKYPLHESPVHHEESTAIRLYGIQITPTLAIVILLGLLGLVILLTMILLVVRSCRMQHEHRNRAAKRELAQSILLEQRAEEEKYLP